MREQTSATIPVNTVWDLCSVLKLVIHYESPTLSACLALPACK